MIYTILYNIYVYTYQSSNSASMRHQTWDEGDGYDQKVHKTMHVISNWHAKSVRRLKSSRRSITITTAMQKIACSSGRSQSIHIYIISILNVRGNPGNPQNVLHVSIRGKPLSSKCHSLVHPASMVLVSIWMPAMKTPLGSIAAFVQWQSCGIRTCAMHTQYICNT